MTAIAAWPIVHTVRCTVSAKSTPNASQNFLLPRLLAPPVQQCSRMLAFGAAQPLQAFNEWYYIRLGALMLIEYHNASEEISRMMRLHRRPLTHCSCNISERKQNFEKF